MILDTKTLSKNKIFQLYVKFHDFWWPFLKICKLGHQDVVSQLANIGFRIQHTKLPIIKVSNPFLHKMPVFVNFSDFFS